jgi:hypothetical protein
MKTAEKLASSIGKGLVAGVAGTAAMTVSSTLEAKLRGRASSSAPARATAKVLGSASFEDAIARRASTTLPLGLRHRLSNRPRPAGRRPASLAARDRRARAVWASEQVTLPALEVAPPSVFWPKREITIDALHHAVYALATGITYEMHSSRNGP